MSSYDTGTLLEKESKEKKLLYASQHGQGAVTKKNNSSNIESESISLPNVHC